jgi:predicted transcriptional regulator
MRKFSKLLDVSHGTVARYENGTHAASMHVLEKLHKIAKEHKFKDVTLERLFKNEDCTYI